MSQVLEFFQKLFDTSDFPPRWHCGRWTEFHGWLYIVSDLAIWAAYFAIPLTIIRFITRKSNVRFTKLYFLFASFILACGSTHLLDAMMFWFPAYRFGAVVRLATAIVSWVTVYNLVKILPMASKLRTADQLEAEIQQRIKAEEQLKVNNAMLNEALQIARLGHWQWDVATNKVTWTHATLRVFGREGEHKEMTYEEYLHNIHPEDRQYVHDRVIEAMDTKVLTSFYHRSIMPDGQVRMVLAKGEVITDEHGKVIKMVGTAQDITDQKAAEQELLLKSQKLEASNVELQKFAYIASHDLREPLRKIITFGSMLEREYTDVIEERGNMYLEKMSSSALRMQKLIDDILDYSKLTVNTVKHTEVNLNEVVAHAVSDLEATILKTGAIVKADRLPEIEGNPNQLGQLFQNLIGNAIKFCRPGTKPEIYIHAQVLTASALPDQLMKSDHYRFSIVSDTFNEHQQFCKIYIEDNGIGFDETYLANIFLIFQRLHDKNAYEGTGVGLAICKKVTDLHNGFITANSRPGEGTTFMVILPIKQPQYASQQHATEKVEDQQTV